MDNMRLKNKILKINSYSILIILFVFFILSFATVYFVIKNVYQKEINFLKQEYISSQEAIIKNQVNNFINFIEHTRKIEKEEKLNLLKQNVKALSRVLSISNPKHFKYMLSNSKKKTPILEIGLSDTKGNVIFATGNAEYHKKFRIKAIAKGYGKILEFNTKRGKKYSYILKFKNQIDNKWYVIGNAIFQNVIDEKVKQIVIDRINSIKFGAKNNGYLSIAEILNYKGGKGFAKVVALPVKPEWVGKLLDDDKKDAKGKMYRKEYLKIANTTKEGYVKYWFFKKKTNELRPKLSYVKLYKPYNWLIFTSVYLDDINTTLKQKEKNLQQEIKQIFIIYLTLSFIFFIIAYLISRYENKVLLRIIDNYEKLISEKNKKLMEINKNLEKEVKEKTQKLLDSLLIDPLTNLPNREKLLIDLKEELYIAIVNIDGFKEINDFYGLEIGDTVLKKIAHIIKYTLVEKVYKLPGDEFAITCEDKDILYKKVEELFYVISNSSIKIDSNISININLSCGIGDTLIEADMALKYAKRYKQKIIIFRDDLKIVKEYENNIKWKNIIHNAIKNDNIIPFVQPIINTKTKQIEKYECLVRLKDNETIYSPYFFLNISKHTHQYYELQKIMVEKTFNKFKNLDYKFSINISTLDLLNDKFKLFLLEKIEQYNVSNKLIIELLEDEELLQPNILEFLYKLRNKGVELAIDDFGSGYSNFSYLIKDLPIDILKIDGSLVKNIAINKDDYKLFKIIVNLAKEFNLKVVAEFVENEDILKVLEELEVEYAQGYYFSEPFDIHQL